MQVQVLVAAVNKDGRKLVQDMNIQTDVVIGNQCSCCSDENFEYSGNRVQVLNRPYRGVGLNRNTALIKADKDIITLADDDMVFVDDYEKIISQAFSEIPDADAIIFNIETKGIDVGRRTNQKIKRLRFYNVFNYGAARISVKRNSILRENINFHQCFGGGTIYSSGEDTIFLFDMLRSGLKLYVYPVCIASVDQLQSSWFQGYNVKYLFDKGALFSAISKKLCWALCLQDLLRHPEIYRNQGLKLSDALKIMLLGKKSFRTLSVFSEKRR